MVRLLHLIIGDDANNKCEDDMQYQIDILRRRQAELLARVERLEEEAKLYEHDS